VIKGDPHLRMKKTFFSIGRFGMIARKKLVEKPRYNPGQPETTPFMKEFPNTPEWIEPFHEF